MENSLTHSETGFRHKKVVSSVGQNCHLTGSLSAEGAGRGDRTSPASLTCLGCWVSRRPYGSWFQSGLVLLPIDFWSSMLTHPYRAWPEKLRHAMHCDRYREQWHDSALISNGVQGRTLQSPADQPFPRGLWYTVNVHHNQTLRYILRRWTPRHPRVTLT